MAISTKITLHSDRTTGISSSHRGANIDGLAFNLTLISNTNPKLAQKIFELYETARGLE